ncbi:MAG: GNAT family N-acetyltransferase [Candidatus Eremiobacteraeota bacterium]|nr:GNAT family N-acetyltransferase [Candidatus Eremiobacteraeota bacterium]
MREAGADDAPLIAELFALPHAADVLNAPPSELVAALLEEPSNEGYIIESDGEPVGHLLLKNFEWLVEFSILIAREPGRGMGRFALEWALRHAFDEVRAHRIYAEVRASNSKTRGLLERLGFEAEGVFRDGFRHHVTGEYENLIPYGLLESGHRGS